MAAYRRHRNYIRQVRRPNSPDFKIIRFGGIALRNIDETGKLLEPCSAERYIQQRIPMWALLSMKIFKDPVSDEEFPVYVCRICDIMKAVGEFHVHQNPDEITELKCQHSEVCDFLVGDTWRDKWELDLEEIRNANHNYDVLLNQDTNHHELRNDDLYLAAVVRKEDISILFTVNSSQKFPFCSKCSHQKCKCFKVLGKCYLYFFRKSLDLSIEGGGNYLIYKDNGLSHGLFQNVSSDVPILLLYNHNDYK